MKVYVNTLKSQSLILGKAVMLNPKWPRTMLAFGQLIIVLFELLKLPVMVILGIALFIKELCLLVWEIIRTVPEDFLVSLKDLLLSYKYKVFLTEDPRQPAFKVLKDE